MSTQSDIPANGKGNGSSFFQRRSNDNMASGESHNQNHQHPQQQQQQPNVRHIPIYVEGRDEPLVNKNIDTTPKSHTNDLSNSKSSGGIFDRVKNFPTINRVQTPNTQRSNSPHRTTIPINMNAKAQFNLNSPRQDYQQQQQRQQPQQQQQQAEQSGAQNKPMSNPDIDSIIKIQNIQRDVLNLMDQVEHFTGHTRKDKQYLYLDEMLTQNLLKLDTISTEGKENIKQARREAIKCINTCIAVLEAKADAGIKSNNGQNMGVSSGNNSQYDNVV